MQSVIVSVRMQWYNSYVMQEQTKKVTVEQIEELITQRKYADIKKIFPPHPEDIARLINQLDSSSYKVLAFRLVPYDKAVDVFEYLPREDEEEMLTSFSSQEIQEILNEMSPDDRTALFDEMPAEIVQKLIEMLSPEERAIAVELLNYPPDSVGRLITPDYVRLYTNMTVAQALEHIRKVGLERETVYSCYVIDNDKRLIGIVSLKKLVIAQPEIEISQIMFKDVIKVNANKDKEEAVNIFKRYDLISLPVVSNNNKILGIVTFDDLVDVLEEEATEDFERIAAVLPVDKPYMEAGFFSLVWKRSFWLILLTILESASSVVMQHYQGEIHKWVPLTFFLPILIATGGNAGMQSAMMVVRGLALGEIKVTDFSKIVLRESLLGLCIGIILTVVGLIRVVCQQSNWLFSVSVGTAMGITIMISAIIGATLPLVFRKLRLDPALMSGPLITTIVDVVGVFIYFEIAKRMLGL